MEELGRGAFGKVHKGVLKDLPKAEVFFKPREERVEVNEGKVVAIKVLLGEQEWRWDFALANNVYLTTLVK